MMRMNMLGLDLKACNERAEYWAALIKATQTPDDEEDGEWENENE